MSSVRRFRRTATVSDRLHLMRSVIPLSFRAWVDSIEDGNVLRKVRGHSFDDVFGVSEKDRHSLFTVIHRKPFTRMEVEHWEFGLTATDEMATYHVWIQLTSDSAERVFKENSDIFE